MRGAVDLSGLRDRANAAARATQSPSAPTADSPTADAAGPGSQAPGAGASAGPGAAIIDVTEATFQSEVLERSLSTPVVIDFWAEWCEPCKQLSPVLERLAVEYNGRFVLAKIDVDANQMLMQQFGVQGIPAVFAVVAGQALPLFQGAAGEVQIRQTLDQLIQVGEQRFGLTGLVVDADAEPGDRQAPDPQAIPAGPYDALLEAAVQALDAGDLGGAVQAYKNVLSDDPGNTEAKLGLVQAELLQRVQDLDPQQVRKDAAEKPGDPAAQIAAADLDLVGGHVEDAFGRLTETVGRTAGDDRDAVRLRLLELFEVVGADDPRVAVARRALARALF